VGEPTAEDLTIYQLVAKAQQECIDALERALAAGERPDGRSIHMISVDVITAGGHGDHYGHGLGHGIGLFTHELPGLGRTAPETPLPSPTVFSVEPGVYIDGKTGVRIEDLVLFDADARKVDLLTMFGRKVTVVGE